MLVSHRDDPIIDICIRELVQAQGCHTVILYGSRASGEHDETSDYDLVGVRPSGSRLRITRREGETYLDLFIFPEELLESSIYDYIYMKDGIVLEEKDGFGTGFLKSLRELYAKGPDILPDDEKEARRVWALKMLDRAARGDMEGSYRQISLLQISLEDYFALRDMWYPGSKGAFSFLREYDPGTLELYNLALAHPLDLSALQSLVASVYRSAGAPETSEAR